MCKESKEGKACMQECDEEVYERSLFKYCSNDLSPKKTEVISKGFGVVIRPTPPTQDSHLGNIWAVREPNQYEILMNIKKLHCAVIKSCKIMQQIQVALVVFRMLPFACF